MNVFLSSCLKRLSFKLSFLFFLFITNIQYAQAIIDVVLNATLNIENPENVPTITTSDVDNTIVLTYKDQNVTDVFAKYTIYGLEQLYPDSSNTSLQERYKISFNNRDLIQDVLENVPTDVSYFGDIDVPEVAQINQDIIDFFNDDKVYEFTGFLSTSDGSNCFPDCELNNVSEGFKFLVTVNYDAENDFLVMETTETTTAGNSFVYKFKTELNHNGLVLWETYSNTSSFLSDITLDNQAERHFFSVAQSRDWSAIDLVLNSDDNSFELITSNQVFGEDTVRFEAVEVDEVDGIDGVTSSSVNGGININVKKLFGHGAGYLDHTYTVTDNVIDLSICYWFDYTLAFTDLENDFEIPLPDFGTYTVNIHESLALQDYSSEDSLSCDNSEIEDIGEITVEYISVEDFNFFANNNFVLESTIVNGINITPINEYSLTYNGSDYPNEFDLDFSRTCFYDEGDFSYEIFSGVTYHTLSNGYFKASYHVDVDGSLPTGSDVPSCELDSFEFIYLFSIGDDDYEEVGYFTRENFTKINYTIDADREGFTLVSEDKPDNVLVFKIEETLSVSELDLEKEIQIVVDSTNKELNIKTSVLSVLNTCIYNVLGEKVIADTKDFINISVAHLTPGVYIVNLQTDKGVVTKKIVIN